MLLSMMPHHAMSWRLLHRHCGRTVMPVPGDTARASRRWRRGVNVVCSMGL